MKPVVIISVDGGPDENPRYAKVIAHAVKHFRDNDLDALFVVTNAPGSSKFNRVEHRMAPLSRELAGLVLPHDHFGSHLNSACKTVDPVLEKKNFEHAGKVLAEVWSGVEIDGFPVVAEYVPPGSECPVPDLPSHEWYTEHVRESQYFLQVCTIC